MLPKAIKHTRDINWASAYYTTKEDAETVQKAMQNGSNTVHSNPGVWSTIPLLINGTWRVDYHRANTVQPV
jgi:hypothetical protein